MPRLSSKKKNICKLLLGISGVIWCVFINGLAIDRLNSIFHFALRVKYFIISGGLSIIGSIVWIIITKKILYNLKFQIGLIIGSVVLCLFLLFYVDYAERKQRKSTCS